MAGIKDIITSRVRIKILKLYFSDITDKYHVRGVVRAVDEEINSVRRELNRLEEAGILKNEKRGNRLYYYLRDDYLYFGDLLSMVAKSTGLGKEFIDNKKKIGNPSFVMFSGRFARRIERKNDDDVDILVIGNIVLPELAALVRKEEAEREHEINYTVMSREEFLFRRKRRDPFLLGILYSSRVMIIGDEEDLVG